MARPSNHRIVQRVPVRSAGVAVLLLGCILLFCCTWGKYITKVELMPGMEWFLVRFGNSKIVWGDKGVVAEGNLSLTFCDDGIEVSCEREPVIYLDVVKNVVLSSDGSFVPDRKPGQEHGLTIFCAESVMGPYGKIAANDFKKERKAFLDRVAKGRLDLGLMDMYMPQMRHVDRRILDMKWK